MLGVTFTSRAVLEEEEARRKKEKRDKKKKKERRSKKEKREKRAAGSSSNDSGPDADVAPRGPDINALPSGAHGTSAATQDDTPKPAAEGEALLQREDWMTRPMRREPSRAAQEAEERDREEGEKRRKEATEPEVVAGLRLMKKPAADATDGPAVSAGATVSGQTAGGAGGRGGDGTGVTAAPGGGHGPGSGGLVGDGGASWRLKALRRAQEQARSEGRSLQEVVQERWGSLAQLTGDLSATAAADGRAHLRAAAERRRAAAEGGPAPPLPHYLQDVRTERTRMLRPAEDTSLSWRRDRDRDRDRGSDKEREGERDHDGRARHEDLSIGHENDRSRDGEPNRGEPDAAGGRGGDAPRGSKREQDRERDHPDGPGQGGGRDRGGRGGQCGDREAEPRGKGRDGYRERGQDERGPGGGGGERPADRSRDGPPGDRDRNRGRGRDWDRKLEAEERGGGRGREQGRDGEEQPRPPRLSREQAAALQQLAGSLNSFADDGSFMDKFLTVQQQQQQRAQAPRPKDEDPEGRRSGDDGHDNGDGGRGRSRPAEAAGPRVGSTDVDVDSRAQSDPRAGRRPSEDPAEPSAGPGPSSSAQGPAAVQLQVPATGGNRGVAAMLRARAAGRGTTIAGGGGGESAGGDGGGAGSAGGAEDQPGAQQQQPTTAARRAPLFVGADGGDDEPGGGGGGGGGGMGNKSAAELLRARLRGLPLPSAAAADGSGGSASGAAGAAAVKSEPHDTDAGPTGAAGPASGSRAPRRDGGSGDVDLDDNGGGGRPRREVVDLPLVDPRGRAVRGAFGREPAGAGTGAGAGRRAGSKPPERYNRQTGEKERYFADDDKVDLQTLVRRAKYGDDDLDQLDSHLATNIAKKRKFRGTDLDADAEYDYDGGLELTESRAKRGGAEAQRQRERSRQVADLRRQANAEAACELCLSNPDRPQHLTVALGTRTHLSLPARGRLLRGHCCIAPAEHCPSLRGLDEPTWTEVKNFIKCLVRMYGAQGQSVIFLETHMTTTGSHRGAGGGGRQQHQRHAVLDAVPVTERQLEKARGYFKKAILEAESEWSTHHAKACIETTAQKGLRESIPPNFPYFYVQFGYGSGYVHVIDDETKFDPNFGRQVLIGLLDLPPEMAHQRQRSESAPAQQLAVRDFTAAWAPFDWTRELE